LFAAATTATAQSGGSRNTPSATFQRNWVEHDVTEQGKKGMRIHTAFKVYSMKGISGYLQIKFQKRDGTALKDNNGAFDDVEGNVAAFREITPGFEPTVYEDYAIFMPHEELDLPGGKYELRMDIDVIYENGELIQHLTFYNFDFTQPSKTTAPVRTGTAPSGKFDRIWIDFDVTEGGKYGMRIHVKFTTYGMKNLPSDLAVYFKKADGTRLLTNNVNYRSTDGQVAIYKELDIGYDPGVFNDLQLFLPYSELSLPKGTYDLTMTVNLIYKEGGLIQHLTEYDFEYTKP
jgi:hypothetical protein